MYELNTSWETLFANRRKNSHVLTYSSTRVSFADNKQLSDPSLKKIHPLEYFRKVKLLKNNMREPGIELGAHRWQR